MSSKLIPSHSSLERAPSTKQRKATIDHRRKQFVTKINSPYGVSKARSKFFQSTDSVSASKWKRAWQWWKSHVLLHLKFFTEHAGFQGFIIIIIALAAINVGIQTYPIEDPDLLEFLSVADTIILVIFTAEVVLKFVAMMDDLVAFFHSKWNVFDLLVVIMGYLPFGGNAVTVLRLVRLLRVLKLVRALPKLRILVMGLLKSMRSIGYIGILLLLLFYIYAVLGVSLFQKNDPFNFPNVHMAFLTLFRCATMEDWSDVMYAEMQGCDVYPIEEGNEDYCVTPDPQPLIATTYFVSFIIIANMLVLNLFVGVITSSMEDARVKLEEELMLEREEKMAMFNKDTSNMSQQEIVAEKDPEVRAYSTLNDLSQLLIQAMSRVTSVFDLKSEVSATASILKASRRRSLVTRAQALLLSNMLAHKSQGSRPSTHRETLEEALGLRTTGASAIVKGAHSRYFDKMLKGTKAKSKALARFVIAAKRPGLRHSATRYEGGSATAPLQRVLQHS